MSGDLLLARKHPLPLSNLIFRILDYLSSVNFRIRVGEKASPIIIPQLAIKFWRYNWQFGTLTASPIPSQPNKNLWRWRKTSGSQIINIFHCSSLSIFLTINNKSPGCYEGSLAHSPHLDHFHHEYEGEGEHGRHQQQRDPGQKMGKNAGAFLASCNVAVKC